MKNAHRTELEKELDKARKAHSNTENADIEEIRRQHEYVFSNRAAKNTEPDASRGCGMVGSCEKKGLSHDMNNDAVNSNQPHVAAEMEHRSGVNQRH